MAELTLTSVPGVRVGHWTDAEALTGVTVIDLPEPNTAGVEVRGGAPGSRETALLAPGKRVEMIQALVFAGGSAFGLAAADGVVAELARDGRGHETIGGRVPIVPAAIIYDLLVGDGRARPGPEQGAAAFRAATSDPVEMGSVGAGTGAIVAGWRGRDAVRKGGVGSAAARFGDATLGALAVANAVGDVFTLSGDALTGGAPIPSSTPTGPGRPLEQTVLVAVVTDAAFGRHEQMHIAVRAHDALAVCFRPAHTRYDGDAVFTVSCGDVAGNLDEAGEVAFAVVGAAIERAVRRATAVPGVPAVELPS
jgi:L-aminopeptidase/D-esterase-like protein